MQPKELFRRVIGEANGTFACVQEGQLGNPTPCTDWDVKTLANHMIYELAWMPDLLAGKTIAEIGEAYEGDHMSGDFHATWNQTAEKALQAVELVELQSTVHLSYGKVTAEHYIKEMAADILIHSWDLGQGTQCSLVIHDEIAQVVYDNALPRKAEMADSGLFGTAIEVSDDAPIQTRLLALYGRKVPTV